MAIVLNYKSLISRFNDGFAHRKRRELYEALKSARVFGQILKGGDQATIRRYLFDTDNCKYWFELPLFETNRLDELEEARVQRYLDLLMERMDHNDPDYPLARDQKARQLLGILRELDDRVDLLELSGDQSGLSLAYLPCSWDTLKKVCQAFPTAQTILDLEGQTEGAYKAKGIRNPGAKQVSAYVARRLNKYRQDNAPPAVVKRLKAAEAAGQRAFF
ncbi:MAG: hypothetical protein WD970_00045 [Patescibacteria group bacterium]